MKFAYTGKNTQGKVQSGLLEAVNQDAAITLLQQAGLIVLKIEQKREGAWYEKLVLPFQRVSLKEVSVFTRQFATLLEAQVPLIDALQTVYAQSTNLMLREVIFDMYSDIQAGLSFSDALAKYDKVFSPFYANMIKAAEMTGRLDSALLYLADYYEQQAYVNTKITNAMIYPVFILVLFVAVVAIMVTVVIPQLGTVILESGVTLDELPMMTQILFGAGSFFTKYIAVVVAVLLGLVVVLVRYFSSEEGKLLASTILLKLPVFGGFLQRMYVARFAETLSVLLKGGIPVASGLDIVAHVIGSVYYQEAVEQIAQGVRQGETISALLLKYPDYFPPLISQMVAVGEKTGRLEELLKKVALSYTREIESLINSLTEIIQPILIVALGVLIGGLIAAVILPIYQVAQRF
ncbi:MAG: hypothetical protein COV41_03055 [Candidatus Brennerbacteria bacterium CG11_big_fil_rev_8_21_14_0_20_43_10]|uniref:Type II secretion system protein GspF domain-containing protein n=1 Tax=Candidatus Brennerbacteria bacterium CG11_big_fil_rev_8_21_14_0_20_43_10 TaxID=1974523 RepID=A0A2H0PTF1_9BACT|nr:MAG: hypothetical protein AUJ43_00355 [Parcubacteria group bacterium CG1_02_44_31]PIP50383.1 MAG: hypothetical protein COX12_01585 [Candidatus Brennerbacteria bacterium CG23_combo_of_CG06-09_8_20_14_all_44_41]PIR25339.1 MAG: hypothetical protein COV41_03055 [Candidatus Brennerbacteria bacterium CG11_big_fil_rev_8_21_14_0_20_43_10]